MFSFYQRCLDKAGSDVCDMYVADSLDGCQLTGTLKIMTGKPFRSGIGRCCSKPLGAGNGTDDCNLTVCLGMRLKISESLSHEVCHAKTIGVDGVKITVCIELCILIANARTVEIEVDAIHLSISLCSASVA